MTADKERNIAHARKAIEEAVEKGAKLVLLPVSSLYLFNYLYSCVCGDWIQVQFYC